MSRENMKNDLFEEFDPLFSNSPATPADKRMNENDKILDAFGIKKENTTTTTTSQQKDNNPFADFADLGAQSPAPVNNTKPAVPLDLNLLMENTGETKNKLDTNNFPVMSAEMLCPSVPNNAGGKN